MPSSVNLGEKLEAVVDELVKNGRYNSRSEVLRAGVRVIHERERQLAELEASIAKGTTDFEAGRYHDLDEVTARLTAKYEAMAEEREAR
jgi:antitoxin ParD1/3/4